MSTELGVLCATSRRLQNAPRKLSASASPIPPTGRGFGSNAVVPVESEMGVVLSSISRPVYSVSVPPIVYKMCGMDANTNGLYDTWKVAGNPDFTGAHYTGVLATPLRNIIVSSSG